MEAARVRTAECVGVVGDDDANVRQTAFGTPTAAEEIRATDDARIAARVQRFRLEEARYREGDVAADAARGSTGRGRERKAAMVVSCRRAIWRKTDAVSLPRQEAYF